MYLFTISNKVKFPFMVISLQLIVRFENLHSYRDYVISTVKGCKRTRYAQYIWILNPVLCSVMKTLASAHLHNNSFTLIFRQAS